MQGGREFFLREVVLDSATHELAGLTGKLSIRTADGTHFYDFDYEMPE